MSDNKFNWHVYERIVAAAEVESGGISISITPNARLLGRLSGKWRQVDVLLDARWGDDLSRRTIVDAKLRNRPIDIKEVESFEGMMKDCSALRGIIVCNSGHTDGALKRAQEAITIKILDLEEVDEYIWAAFDPCMGKCGHNSGCNHGLVLWDGQQPLPLGPGWAIVFTGKCDICHEFNVWCWDCGEKFTLSSEDEYKCGCELIWVSELDKETGGSERDQLNAVNLLVVSDEESYALDRRALR